MNERISRYKVAAVQAAPVLLDAPATLEKTAHLVEEAANQGAQLIVFPETWIPGYPFWYNNVELWKREPIKRTYARLFKNSVDVPGPLTDALGKMAKKADIYIFMGINERVPSGTLYNSMVFIGRDGSLMGKHRKLVPTFLERMVWGQGDASTLNVFDTDIGRLSGLICWEHWMPLTRYSLYSQGMQVCASVWPGRAKTSLLASQHMAFEGRCFVVASSMYLTKAHIPADFELAEEVGGGQETILSGGSTIIGPDGQFLAEPEFDKETIAFAEIDLERILEEKQFLDVVGHYARPEVFTLTLNRQAFQSFQANDVVDVEKELFQLQEMAGKVTGEKLEQEIRKLREKLRAGVQA